MAIVEEPFHYEAGGAICKGWITFEKASIPRPAVLIAPAFGGVSQFDRDYAAWIASTGYVGVAIDYYGNGTRVETSEEASALMATLNADRPLLRDRMIGALQAAQNDTRIDEARVAAMGFCFGGKAVLDLARSGTPFAAGISLHGVLESPDFETIKMNTELLLLHGWDDPLGPAELVETAKTELSKHCEIWQLHGFGNTGHSFTNPKSDDYNARATATCKVLITDQLSSVF